jgi:high-affinity nickel-transport protein
VMSRLMAVPLRRVRRPRHMYPIGFAFGIGFDTATLIGLLVLTATTVASGMAAVYAVALPLCFAAGMTLGDSLNGYFMMRMYARADDARQHAPRFNQVVITMSVVSALSVGTLILVATARESLGLTDAVTGHLAAIDLEYAGVVLMGAFAIAGSALLVHRRRHGDPSRL